MSALAINSPEGKLCVDAERRAVAIYVCSFENLEWIPTRKNGSSRIDGFLKKDGELDSCVEVKARHLTERMLFESYKGKWLISFDKLIAMQSICGLLNIEGIGILYLIDSGAILVKRIVDREGNFVKRFEHRLTTTQDTIHGGSKIEECAFFPMDGALKLTLE